MGSEGKSGKKKPTASISKNVLKSTCIALTALIAVTGFTLAIVALVSNDDESGVNESNSSFTSLMDQTIVTSDSPNITAKLTILEDRVFIDVATWTGTCYPAGSPPYAPSITTVTAIPRAFRSVNSQGTVVSSGETTYRTETNSTINTGFAYVNSNGKIVFHVSTQDVYDTWWATCRINAFTMVYGRNA
jgi:hypothetical protein